MPTETVRAGLDDVGVCKRAPRSRARLACRFDRDLTLRDLDLADLRCARRGGKPE